MGWDSQQHSLTWLLVVAGVGHGRFASDDDVTSFGVTNFVMMSHIEVSASQADSSASIPEASAFLSELRLVNELFPSGMLARNANLQKLKCTFCGFLCRSL
jgi:hypothetical protein